MRQRLFFISLVLIIFSIASGLGLRYALAIAWTEPSALPPGDNVPAPINVGAGAQIKTGDLTIGGNFAVSSGEIIGAPAGGNMGAGTLNAEQLCIQGNCRLNWPEAVNAFVDEGNVGFGPTAVLGTNDAVPLSFETSGLGRMWLTTAGNLGLGTAAPGSKLGIIGNLAIGAAFAGFAAPGDGAIIQGKVGIGTEAPNQKLVVKDNAVRAYLWASGGNPELDFGDGATHWAIYRDAATDQLRFWRDDNRVYITNTGNVGIGIEPSWTLDVYSTESLTGRVYNLAANGTGLSVEAAGANSTAVNGVASNALGKNYGGYFTATNMGSEGVLGQNTAAAGINYGVHGKVSSTTPFARGVYGEATGAGSVMGVYGEATSNGAVANYGGYFTAAGTLGVGVKGSGASYGGFFQASGAGGTAVYGEAGAADGWGGYFLGGKGVYAEAEVVGGAAGGYQGAGTLNAVKLCIDGNCLAAWPAGTAPGGVAGQIQFNDGGVFAGDAGLAYDKAIDVLAVGGNLKVGTAAAGDNDSIYFDDGTESRYVRWEDVGSRFNISHSIFVQGQISGAAINTYSGGAILTYDNTNQKAIKISHNGTNGVIETYTAFGIDTGNLVLQSTFAGRNVTVNDDLVVTGNATVSGKNVCLQDGTNCPAGGGTVQLQAVTPGVQQVGHLNISGTGIFGGLQIDALNGVLKSAGGVVSGAATTTDLPEGVNLYFTNARARAAISVTDGPLSYNPATGVMGFSLPLSVLYGGTGTMVLPPAGAVAYGTGGAFAFTGVGVAGQFLKSAGAGAPTWGGLAAGDLPAGSTNYIWNGSALQAGNFNISGSAALGGINWLASYGVRAQGATAGGYFEDAADSGKAYIGWGNNGVAGYGNNYGGYFSDLDSATYGYIGYGAYSAFLSGYLYNSGDALVTGNFTADNNTPTSCGWVTPLSAVAPFNNICPGGQFLAGISLTAQNGSVDQIYCCEL